MSAIYKGGHVHHHLTDTQWKAHRMNVEVYHHCIHTFPVSLSHISKMYSALYKSSDNIYGMRLPQICMSG